MIHVVPGSLGPTASPNEPGTGDEPTGPVLYAWDAMGRLICSADSEKRLQQRS